jgi:hypothetical protein
MNDDRSVDRVVDRLAFSSERGSGSTRTDQPDREARILAHIRRIRSDPRWRSPGPSSSAA